MRDFSFEFLGLYDYQVRKLPRPELVNNRSYWKGYLIAPKICDQPENFFSISQEAQQEIVILSFQQTLEQLDVLIRLERADLQKNYNNELFGFGDALSGKGPNSTNWKSSYAYQKGFYLGWKEFLFLQKMNSNSDLVKDQRSLK